MTPEHLPTEQYEAQLAEKVVRLQSMMAPFSDLVPEVFRSPVSHYRMRAEFRIWHDGDDLYHIIFDQQTKSRIRVDSFPAACFILGVLLYSTVVRAEYPDIGSNFFPAVLSVIMVFWIGAKMRNRKQEVAE